MAQLGELDGQGRARAGALALRITGREEQYELFEAPPGRSEPVAVRLDQVRLERARRFGDVWLGWRLWRALGLDRFCEDRLVEGRERVPWSAMAAILVIARLCEPSSELHIAEDWYRRTALDDLLGVPAERVNDDRLYRALDRLLPHKQALEDHLKERLGALFELDYELLLYDVTSTYFEGQAEGNPLARRGYSRDHRPDCKQVCIGLVVTRDGMPLGYEVFAGNRTDVTTVEEIVTTMERRYGQARRVWVMDRGMASAENIAWLQGSQRRYLIGASKSELKKFAGPLADRRDWRQVRDGVEAKVCAGPDGSETFLLVRSAERQQKEQAMHARFCERIETALASLQRRLERAQKPIDRSAAERQIGRLLGRNSRAAARYAIRLVDDRSCRRPAARMVEARRMGRLVAPQRRLLRAAHQSARLELRGAVADLHPALRSGSGLSHPQERAVDPSRSGISARIACSPTSWSAFSPTCCGRRWSNGRAAPVSATVRAPSSRNSPPSTAPTSSCRRRHLPAANCDCAASCAPIAPKPSCSSASVSACPNDSACPARRAKCSANLGPKYLKYTRARPRNCGSWASPFVPPNSNRGCDPPELTAAGMSLAAAPLIPGRRFPIIREWSRSRPRGASSR